MLYLKWSTTWTMCEPRQNVKLPYAIRNGNTHHLELNSRTPLKTDIKKTCMMKSLMLQQKQHELKIYVNLNRFFFFSRQRYFAVRTRIRMRAALGVSVYACILLCFTFLPSYHRQRANECCNNEMIFFSALFTCRAYFLCLLFFLLFSSFWYTRKRFMPEPIYIQWSSIELWTGFPTSIDPLCIQIYMCVYLGQPKHIPRKSFAI